MNTNDTSLRAAFHGEPYETDPVTNVDAEKFAANLRAEIGRQTKGFPGEWFTTDGDSISLICKALNGEIDPTTEVVASIATALGCPVERLLFSAGRPIMPIPKEICCAAIAEIFVQCGYDKPSEFARKHRCSRDKDAPLSMCCVLCGLSFAPQKASARYCSIACKQEAIRRNDRANKAKRKAERSSV